VKNAPAGVSVKEFPYHVNQPEFAEEVAREFMRLCGAVDPKRAAGN